MSTSTTAAWKAALYNEEMPNMNEVRWNDKDKKQRISQLIYAEHPPRSELENQIYAAAFLSDEGECWDNLLDEREDKEVELAKVYARDFAHGTAGHNRLILIEKLAVILDCYENVLEMALREERS